MLSFIFSMMMAWSAETAQMTAQSDACVDINTASPAIAAECRKVIATGSWDQKAVRICTKKHSFNKPLILKCLKAVKDRKYKSSDLYVCAQTEVLASNWDSVINCLEKFGQ